MNLKGAAEDVVAGEELVVSGEPEIVADNVAESVVSIVVVSDAERAAYEEVKSVVDTVTVVEVSTASVIRVVEVNDISEVIGTMYPVEVNVSDSINTTSADVLVGPEESDKISVSEIETRTDVVGSSNFDIIKDVGMLDKVVDGCIDEADADAKVSPGIDDGAISRESIEILLDKVKSVFASSDIEPLVAGHSTEVVGSPIVKEYASDVKVVTDDAKTDDPERSAGWK